jgi:4-diphosphocytidyl-2-C-methyl-D-erythritol kinase
MLYFPPAKINLGLRILRKRPDGYHELETCFFPVLHFCDALEVIISDKDELNVYRADWPSSPEKNLVWKAMELFREYEKNLPPLHWHLLKQIPSGAGLGGGSSDAAIALKMMAELAGWQENDDRLHEMAAKLGSDCAFFLFRQAAIGRGRGELLQPFPLDLSSYEIRLVLPSVRISTAEAFSRVIPAVPEQSLEQILVQPVESWKGLLVNDFENSVFHQYPELKQEKDKLYAEGAVYASLSGSGSALFGLFRK